MNDTPYVSCLVLAVLAFWIVFALRHFPSAVRMLRRDVLSVLMIFAVAASLVADKTNGLMRIIAQLRSPAPVAATVTAEDIARGWRIESISANEAISYEMPVDATYVGNWHVHGARSSFGNNKIAFSDFSFPLGTNSDSFSSFWYFVDGMIRPTPRDATREIRAAGGPMFAKPGASRLWTVEDPDGSQVLTWENFFLGSDTNVPVNAQIRLYGNGDFTTSSNELVTVCRRVEPFDWDGDGLANDIDPEPYSGSDDFHGTCAAWYNVACSNILTAADGDCGVELTWRDGVNSNAYYFVEVVAERGPSEVVFSASQAGNLGSPVVVVHAGETNTVPLLVGVEYAVTSTVPISVTAPANGHALVSFDSPKTCMIRWPVTFAFAETIGEPAQSGNAPRTYEVTAGPFDPGGIFSWDSPGGCHCITYIGYRAVYNCSPECTCGGNCLVSGWFGFEGIFLPVAGGECRCGFTDTVRPAVPQDEGPCVSVSFSDSAVIYEDSYSESPGVWKPKRSTRTWLTVHANGGPNGGTLSFASQNLEKLAPVACGPVVLPLSINLASNETFSAQYLLEGELPSAATNDISVTGSLLPTGANEAIQSASALTSVKVELGAMYDAPENPCASRHTYGVGELVCITTTPSSGAIGLSVVRGNTSETNLVYDSFGTALTTNGSGPSTYRCPIVGTFRPNLTVALGDASYKPIMNLVEPQSVICREAEIYDEADIPFVCLPSGSVGGVLMKTINYIGPMDVSFEGVMVAEIPCDDVIPPSGYFATTNYTGAASHTTVAGAGKVYRIKAGNYWASDRAGRRTAYINWSEGRMEWKIPIGWLRMTETEQYALNPPLRNITGPDYEQCDNAQSRPLLIGGKTDTYKQIFTISLFGTASIEKFGHTLSRSIFCVITLDGNIIQWKHSTTNE